MEQEQHLALKDMVWPAAFACVLEELVGNHNAAKVIRKAVVKLLRDARFPSRHDRPMSRTMVLNSLVAVGVPELFAYSSAIPSSSERWSQHFVRLQSFRMY
jgi:hypothetical protein